MNKKLFFFFKLELFIKIAISSFMMVAFEKDDFFFLSALCWSKLTDDILLMLMLINSSYNVAFLA